MNTFQKIENESEWEDLLDKALFKTFFHTPVWESFLEKEFFWLKFEHYLWRDELLLSIARCRMFGKEKIVSHPFCEYGGPLPLKDSVGFGEFISDFRQFFGERARIKFHPYILPKQASNPPRNNPLPSGTTFWLENFSKKSPENLWGGFRKTLKQEIKKGEGFVEIKECGDEDELKQFYSLYLRTVKRHKNIPLPFSAVTFFYNHAKIFVAKNEGRVVGGSVFLLCSPFIHYFISASDEKFRSKKIGHQILWHVMRAYAGREYDYFDLGGTRKGSSLEIFKRGWGTKEYLIHEIGGSSKGSANSTLRNILGLIPPSIMKRFATLALWAKI